MEHWRARCTEIVEQHRLDPSWHDVLRAFDGPEVSVADLPRRIVATLSAEVDADQAALFGRRFDQVTGLLGGLGAVEARILEPFLAHRAAGILAADPPHALRIRALVDYVFGLVSVVVHRDPSAPAAEVLVRTAVFIDVAPGVAHCTIAGGTTDGPVHLNVLRLRDVHLEAFDGRPAGDLVALAAAHRAVAAFSGGFFLYSEPDITLPARRGDPVGALVSDGQVRGLPAFRRSALLQRTDGSIDIAVLGPQDATWVVGGHVVRPVATNDPHGPTPAVYNRAFGDRSPRRDEPAVAIADGRVVAVGRGGLPIPLAGVVLVGVEAALGAPVRVEVPGVRTAMSGGPRLVGSGALDLAAEDFAHTAPPITFSRDETYDTNRLPRMGVGIDPAGTLWVLAVDGRDLRRAPGLTLRRTGELLAALGCVRAANLDGGSSKRMVVRGQVVDLPTTEVVAHETEARVRPVHSAVLVRPRTPGLA